MSTHKTCTIKMGLILSPPDTLLTAVLDVGNSGFVLRMWEFAYKWRPLKVPFIGFDVFCSHWCLSAFRSVFFNTLMLCLKIRDYFMNIYYNYYIFVIVIVIFSFDLNSFGECCKWWTIADMCMNECITRARKQMSGRGRNTRRLNRKWSFWLKCILWMNNSNVLFSRALPGTGPPLSPYWTFWTPISSRAADDSSSTRATEVSGSWTRTERRTGEGELGSARPAWNPAKAATVRRNTRAVSLNAPLKPGSLIPVNVVCFP